MELNMSTTEDVYDSAIANIQRARATKQQLDRDVPRWWTIFVNEWASFLRDEARKLNVRLKPLNLTISDVGDNRKADLKTILTVSMTYAVGGFHGAQAIAIPPLTFVMQKTGKASYETDSQLNMAPGEIGFDDPEAHDRLAEVLAQYVSAAGQYVYRI
jgi:hypothetical protein